MLDEYPNSNMWIILYTPSWINNYMIGCSKDDRNSKMFVLPHLYWPRILYQESRHTFVDYWIWNTIILTSCDPFLCPLIFWSVHYFFHVNFIWVYMLMNAKMFLFLWVHSERNSYGQNPTTVVLVMGLKAINPEKWVLTFKLEEEEWIYVFQTKGLLMVCYQNTSTVHSHTHDE